MDEKKLKYKLRHHTLPGLTDGKGAQSSARCPPKHVNQTAVGPTRDCTTVSTSRVVILKGRGRMLWDNHKQ